MKPTEIADILLNNKLFNNFTLNEFTLRAVLLQTSIHLARFDRLEMSNKIVFEEFQKHYEIVNHKFLNISIPKENVNLRDLVFTEIDEITAKTILENYHYLNSHRENSIHLGLVEKRTNIPVVINSYSINDIPKLINICNKSLILSRVFAFSNAPKNSLSFLFAKSRDFIRKKTDVESIYTYINPNLGFKGSSYIADNWNFLMEEETKYVYENDFYHTERYFLKKYGRNTDELLFMGTENITSSKIQLLPLKIFNRKV